MISFLSLNIYFWKQCCSGIFFFLKKPPPIAYALDII